MSSTNNYKQLFTIISQNLYENFSLYLIEDISDMIFHCFNENDIKDINDFYVKVYPYINKKIDNYNEKYHKHIQYCIWGL